MKNKNFLVSFLKNGQFNVSTLIMSATDAQTAVDTFNEQHAPDGYTLINCVLFEGVNEYERF